MNKLREARGGQNNKWLQLGSILRGWGETKWKYINKLINKERWRIICNQETELKIVRSDKCYNLLGDNNIGWVHRETNKEMKYSNPIV